MKKHPKLLTKPLNLVWKVFLLDILESAVHEVTHVSHRTHEVPFWKQHHETYKMCMEQLGPYPDSDIKEVASPFQYCLKDEIMWLQRLGQKMLCPYCNAKIVRKRVVLAHENIACDNCDEKIEAGEESLHCDCRWEVDPTNCLDVCLPCIGERF